jgi:hypothetical protein
MTFGTALVTRTKTYDVYVIDTLKGTDSLHRA